MDITIDPGALLKALSTIDRVCRPKSGVQAMLGNVLLEATQAEFNVAGTNLENSVSIAVPATVAVPHAPVCVSRKSLMAFCQSVSGSLRLTLSEDGKKLAASASSTHSNLPTIDAAEFPKLPFKQKMPFLTIPGDQFAQAVAAVTPCASREDSRPVFTAVLLSATPEAVTLVAADGFRLAHCRLPLQVGEEQTLLIPARFLEALGPALTDSPVSLIVSDLKNQVIVSSGALRAATRLIDGVFPNYRQIMPSSFTSEATFPAISMADAVRTASTVRPVAQRVQLTIDAGAISIDGEDSELGDVKTEIDAQTTGEPLSVLVNWEFFSSTLRALPASGLVKVGFNQPSAPLRVAPVVAEDDGMQVEHIIMPMTRAA